ncbi:UDP-N-acetylglucosamine--N-acetylmuramyl- (pentapeptide) pyrophosphoryl-undecaprenol N-acetylglucosamine transferase [Chitinispirillum alkaliphilum]|nr:UDP-N-acetylglucosamine--N-acetylmuramyl- (pentapeptide) pyrophosphoryl-undecaprenol N-acetylglucosamine transferase [Chitinispirillum alkaliphilum]
MPAVSVVLELRRRCTNVSFAWVGSGHKGEKEVCKKYNISHILLESVKVKKGEGQIPGIRFVGELYRFNKIMSKDKPSAILAFGGQESAPVLAAARLKRIPYYLMESNAVADPVNRFFASGAKKIFLGHSSINLNVLHGTKEVTGIPVRQVVKGYNKTEYPSDFDRSKTTVLICNGEGYSSSFNSCLIETVKEWLENGMQVVWQTGVRDYGALTEMFKGYRTLFLFSEVKDLYPFYAASKIVVGRSEPDFLAEIAYFGLPCMLISSPSSGNNVQWLNAGLVQNQGWARRFQEGQNCGEQLYSSVKEILQNEQVFEMMCRKALDNAPINAVNRISEVIINDLGIKA